MIVVAIVLTLNGVGSGVSFTSAIIAIAINIGLAEADGRRLKRAGVEISSWKAALLVPAYLWTRASKLRQSNTIPIVWCISAVVSLGGSGIVSSIAGVSIDTQAVEVQIANGIQQQTGISTDVQCPEGVAVRPGSSFRCIASGRGQTVMVEVTVQNANGDIIWQTLS